MNMIRNFKLSERSYYIPLTAVISITIGYSISQVVPDIFYSLRMFIIESFTTKQTDPQITLDMSGIVYPTMVFPVDIDRNGHMTNFRYIRELNFARRHFFVSSGLWSYLRQQNLNLIVRTQTIRHRKELRCWQRYVIRTRLLGSFEINETLLILLLALISFLLHHYHHILLFLSLLPV
jgi:hypothetical protein